MKVSHRPPFSKTLEYYARHVITFEKLNSSNKPKLNFLSNSPHSKRCAADCATEWRIISWSFSAGTTAKGQPRLFRQRHNSFNNCLLCCYRSFTRIHSVYVTKARFRYCIIFAVRNISKITRQIARKKW